MSELTPEIIARVDASVRRDAALAQKHGGTLGHFSRNGMKKLAEESPAPPDIVCDGCGRPTWSPNGGALCVGCQSFGPPSKAALDRSALPPQQGDPGSPSRAGSEKPSDRSLHTDLAAHALDTGADTPGPAASRVSRAGGER